MVEKHRSDILHYCMASHTPSGTSARGTVPSSSCSITPRCLSQFLLFHSAPGSSLPPSPTHTSCHPPLGSELRSMQLAVGREGSKGWPTDTLSCPLAGAGSVPAPCSPGLTQMDPRRAPLCVQNAVPGWVQEADWDPGVRQPHSRSHCRLPKMRMQVTPALQRVQVPRQMMPRPSPRPGPSSPPSLSFPANPRN